MLDDEVVIRLLDQGAVRSADGRRLGRVGQLFRSDSDGESTWVSIDAGDDGLQTLVPMAGSTVDGDDLQVAFPADAITGAPQVAVGAPVSGDEERRIRAFYALEPTGESDPPTDVVSVVRSEERLNVATQWVPLQRARLEKFQVTETRMIEVPWTREDVRVVYEPLDGAVNTVNAVNSDRTASGPPRPWVLLEERIVVTKEWVPAERVRLVVERKAGQQDVTGSVRKEQVAVDQVATAGADAAVPAAAGVDSAAAPG